MSSAKTYSEAALNNIITGIDSRAGIMMAKPDRVEVYLKLENGEIDERKTSPAAAKVGRALGWEKVLLNHGAWLFYTPRPVAAK